MRWLTSWVFVVALVTLDHTVAHAADPSANQADELIKQGFQLRLQGKNVDALELFNRAHAISPSGKTLGQIGAVEAALRRWLDAETHLMDALGRHDAWTDLPKNREMLEKTLADVRQQIARVRLVGTAGAEISIEGKRIGVLPIPDPVRVPAGTLRVRATASGRQVLEKELTARGGKEVTATIELALVAPSPPATPPALVATPSPPERSRSAWRGWTGALLGAAGLAAVGTGIAWLAMDSDPTCSAPSGAVCQNLYDTKTQGWAAIGVGVGVAGAGAALLLWPTRDARSGLGLNLGLHSVTFTGRF